MTYDSTNNYKYDQSRQFTSKQLFITMTILYIMSLGSLGIALTYKEKAISR